MIGKQPDNTDMFQCVTMEDLVPAGHPLRRLKHVVDLSFIRDKVVHLYAKVGRASYDPEVIARMWILQHLYGFSERQICDEVTMHAGYRWFCGLSFNERVPDQSTLVKLRTQKWANTDVWQALLDETVRAAEALGICRPDRVGVDGTQINANAATNSLEEIPPALTIIETAEPPGDPNPGQCVRNSASEPTPPIPTNEISTISEPPAPPLMIESGGRTHGKHRSGDPDWHGEKFSNSTHRSTTDSEARLYRKGKNQEAKLRYLGHYLADVRSGVIYGAMATQATGTAEREAALALLDGMKIKPKEVVFDLGYRDGGFLADVIDRNIQPMVAIGAEPLETVPRYLRQSRKPDVTRKRLERIRAARARNQTRSASAGRRGAAAQRQRTRLEHLYAEGKDHHGLDRARGRGLVRVDQQVKLTAAVQNMKRLLNLRPRRGLGSAISLPALFSLLQTALKCSMRHLRGHWRHNHEIRRPLVRLPQIAHVLHRARTNCHYSSDF